MHVGNYVIEQELGGGGMARVYRVRHAILDTHHALKVLEPELRSSAQARERFLAEGRIQAKLLNHPNIVKVTEVIATEVVAALVMELVSGPTLGEHIAAHPDPLAADDVRAIFLPVLAAVGAAHDQGIIHRDIKPGNILLAEDEDGPVPKVTDFGIAKVIDDSAIGRQLSTRGDARMGTVAYMSPEQISSAKDVTARSDIFSLGVTLYELATGKAAFDHGSDFELMRRIVEGRFRRPRQIHPGIDPAIARAIVRAMSPRPADRFASCEEFASALRPPAPTQPIVKPMPAAASPGKSRRRLAAWAAGITALASLLVLLGVVVATRRDVSRLQAHLHRMEGRLEDTDLRARKRDLLGTWCAVTTPTARRGRTRLAALLLRVQVPSR
jgi:serine/threonine-protein kinase